MPRAQLIDQVDHSDQPIGTIVRSEARVVGANFRTAHVFLFDRRGDLLLQRLAAGRELHPGRWGSSVAAYLHAGETYEQAAKRRLDEELGIRRPLRFVGKTVVPDGPSRKFVTLFSAENGGVTIAEPDHIAELRFWGLGELAAAATIDPEKFTPTLLHLLGFYLDGHDHGG